MKRDEALNLLHTHQTELREKYGVQSLSLFGSVARDQARPDSDVDLLVEFNRPVGVFGLLALILIAQEDAAVGIPLVESLQATFADRMKAEREAKSNGNNRGRPASVLADYLVFQACLQSPTFVSLYEHRLPQFRRQLQQQSGGSVLNFINSDWARRASSPIAPDLKFPSDPFAHWVPVGGGNGNAQPLPWWSLYQDQLMSLGGAYESKLLFRYPLAGDHLLSRWTILVSDALLAAQASVVCW